MVTTREVDAQLAIDGHRVDALETELMYIKAIRNRDRELELAAEVITEHQDARGNITDASQWEKYKAHTRGAKLFADEAKMLKKVTREHVKLSVKSEARTYSPFRSASWFRDIAIKSLGPVQAPFGEYDAAAKRLDAHGREVAAEMRSGSAEGKRARRVVRESVRGPDIAYNVANGGKSTRATVREAEERAVSSTTAGSLVTPYYLVSDQATYRTPVASFTDQSQALPLPNYGLTVYLPSWSSGATAGQQNTENSGIDNSAPTSVYLSAPVATLAGSITVSQQLFDRGGDGVTGFDTLAYAQLKENLDTEVDSYVLAQVLATAGAVTEASALTVELFLANLSDARNNMGAVGVRLRPTHLFANQKFTDGWLTAQYDTTGRPIFEPEQGSIMLADPVGSPVLRDAWSGYYIGTSALYVDDNIPTQVTTNGAQVLLCAMNEVFTWRGDPVFRAIPETEAVDLSVQVQTYSYAAALARYGAAVQVLSGSGYESLAD